MNQFIKIIGGPLVNVANVAMIDVLGPFIEAYDKIGAPQEDTDPMMEIYAAPDENELLADFVATELFLEIRCGVAFIDMKELETRAITKIDEELSKPAPKS